MSSYNTCRFCKNLTDDGCLIQNYWCCINCMDKITAARIAYISAKRKNGGGYIDTDTVQTGGNPQQG